MPAQFSIYSYLHEHRIGAAFDNVERIPLPSSSPGVTLPPLLPDEGKRTRRGARGRCPDTANRSAGRLRCRPCVRRIFSSPRRCTPMTAAPRLVPAFAVLTRADGGVAVGSGTERRSV